MARSLHCRVMAKQLMPEFVRVDCSCREMCVVVLKIGVELFKLIGFSQDLVIVSGDGGILHCTDRVIERRNLIVFVPWISEVEPLGVEFDHFRGSGKD